MPSRRSPVGQREPITVERITQAALDLVEESGYASLSMRAVAARLNTGQASLYVHVRSKAELDRLLLAKVFDDYEAPEGASWRDRLSVGSAHLLRTYAQYPGLAVGGFASLPTTDRFLEDLEGDLAQMCAAGLELRQATVAHIAISLVVAARSLEDAAIAERIAESGLSSEEWWAHARQAMTANSSRYPLVAQASAWVNPEARAWVTEEVVELVLDGAEARYAGLG